MLLLASPWTTMETNLPSRKNNASKDLILGTNNPFMYKAVSTPAYGKGYKAKDPRVSPVHADLTGLPPILIQTGGYELFLDENLALARKAAEAGVDITLTVYPAMSHDFALLLPELQESVDSFKEIRDFVRRHLD
jgi:acetyl esterase/lipase